MSAASLQTQGPPLHGVYDRNMPDIFTKVKRSEVMSRILGCGNKETEEALAILLRQHRIRGWRRHWPIFGKPDFIFPKSRIAVFVDGCFWHGCPKHGTKPKSNRSYWRRKLERNKERDRLVTRTLRHQGWHVIRIWNCALQKHPMNCLRRIQRTIGAEKPCAAGRKRDGCRERQRSE